MSFQDMVGTSGRGGSSGQVYGGGSFRNQQINNQQYDTSASALGNAKMMGASTSYALSSISEAIVQYQKNLGILSKIAESIGSKADNHTIQTQYRTQVDVIEQLGSKIEHQMSSQEDQMKRMQREEAARCRSTHVKLNRDFRQVQSTYRNLTNAVRRKQELVMAQRQDEETKARYSREGPKNSGQLQLQVQVQEEALNQQIMRERESEIKNINKSMHQVNEIFKDLAHLVDTQQTDIDKIEGQMENAHASAKSGLTQVEKANNHTSVIPQQCAIS